MSRDAAPSPVRVTAARPPTLGRDRAPGVEPLGIFVGGATIVVSLLFVLAGIGWPQAADALFRLYVAMLALGCCAALALRSILPMRIAEELHTPFDRYSVPGMPPAAPRPLRDLAGAIGAADDERLSERKAIPATIRRTVREEAARRLAERHRLKLDDPADHPRIRSLVSEPTWLLVRPSGRAGSPSAPSGEPVPLRRLGEILDDLERL